MQTWMQMQMALRVRGGRRWKWYDVLAKQAGLV
jgi:hypothetical protein